MHGLALKRKPNAHILSDCCDSGELEDLEDNFLLNSWALAYSLEDFSFSSVFLRQQSCLFLISDFNGCVPMP